MGRGLASALSAAGLRVYATGRTIARADLPNRRPPPALRPPDDAQVEAAFARVLDEAGRIDVLVNSAWGGYERVVEDGQFTWPAPFWEQPRWRWEAMFEADVRATGEVRGASGGRPRAGGGDAGRGGRGGVRERSRRRGRSAR